MTRNKFFSFTGILAAGIVLMQILGSCVDHDLPRIQLDDSCLITISYADNVKPIVLSNCAITGCHNGDNGDEKNWTVFENFQERALNGILQDRITRNALAIGHMPKERSITQEQIQTIYCWVEQGALDN